MGQAYVLMKISEYPYLPWVLSRMKSFSMSPDIFIFRMLKADLT